MALITCPECGREKVSNTAVACPYCGYNIRAALYENNKAPQKNNSNEKKVLPVRSDIAKEKTTEICKKIKCFVTGNRKKIVLILGTIVALVVIGVAVNYAVPVIKNELAYRQAKTLLSNQQYDEANIIFKELGAYKDSSDMSLQSIYEKADNFYSENEYDKAMDVFLSIIDYSDSRDKYIAVSKDKARAQYEDGEYEDAIDTLNKIATDTDVSTEIKECMLGVAANYILDGNYQDAIKVYEDYSEVELANTTKEEWTKSQRETVIKDINNSFSIDDYREEQQNEITALLKEFETGIDEIKDVDSINSYANDFLSRIGAVKTDAQLKKEEELAEKAKLTSKNIGEYIQLKGSLLGAATLDPQIFRGVLYGTGAFAQCKVTASPLKDVKFDDVTIKFSIKESGYGWGRFNKGHGSIKLSEDGTGATTVKVTTALDGGYPTQYPNFSVVITDVSGKLKIDGLE